MPPENKRIPPPLIKNPPLLFGPETKETKIIIGPNKMATTKKHSTFHGLFFTNRFALILLLHTAAARLTVLR